MFSCSVMSNSVTSRTVVHQVPLSGIFQVRILKWVSSYFLRGFSQSRGGICVSISLALQVYSLPLSHWEAQKTMWRSLKNKNKKIELGKKDTGKHGRGGSSMIPIITGQRWVGRQARHCRWLWFPSGD